MSVLLLCLQWDNRALTLGQRHCWISTKLGKVFDLLTQLQPWKCFSSIAISYGHWSMLMFTHAHRRFFSLQHFHQLQQLDKKGQYCIIFGRCNYLKLIEQYTGILLPNSLPMRRFKACSASQKVSFDGLHRCGDVTQWDTLRTGVRAWCLIIILILIHTRTCVHGYTSDVHSTLNFCSQGAL